MLLVSTVSEPPKFELVEVPFGGNDVGPQVRNFLQADTPVLIRTSMSVTAIYHSLSRAECGTALRSC
jgi:hypothetical protein